MKDLIVKHKKLQSFKTNVGEYFYNLWIREEFLNKLQKALPTKEKATTFYFTWIKKLCSRKHNKNKWKSMKWEKIFITD